MWRRLHDDLGRPVALAAPPRRMVSLVPSLTELVCALGRGDRLVGVTRYCTEPPDVVAGLRQVGGTKNPDLSSIVALAPELVLVNAEENRREDFQSLMAAGLTVWVSFPRTVEQTAASIERLGEGLDATAAAAAVAREITAALATPLSRRVRIFCPIWRKPWMSFNRDTYADDLLRCAGGDNVCAGLTDRYPVVDLHTIAQTDPQVILLPDEPYPFAERHRQALGPLLEGSAGRAGRVHLVDGKALSWYGPRTAAALRDFRRLLAGA